MKTTLTGKKEVAEGTMLFSFAKPEGFEYMAGQSLDLILVNPPETDDEGNKRAFSITSDPSSPELKIATRMRDTAFKRVLRDMGEGTEIEVEGPFGSFTLHENAARPAVFLAGGIGITPFHAMVHDATTRKLPNKIILFYSNRRPEDATFLEGLTRQASENPNFTFVPTMTDMEKSKAEWSGATGYIDEALVKKHVDLAASPIFYLAGPAGMVAAMRKMLNDMGVSNDDIRTEEFSGY
ncbi:MAG TPA: FAD-dependent oxidoreductase [Candidatus Paceibacterota bacterium]|nr:FAD-dependent oxidoreductase [Candidatus Paceibacterota bacterium]